MLRRCRVARKQYVATVASATVGVRSARASPPDAAHAVASALRAGRRRGRHARLRRLAAEGVDAKRRGRTSAGGRPPERKRLRGIACDVTRNFGRGRRRLRFEGQSPTGPRDFDRDVARTAPWSGDGALTAATAAEDALSIALSIENGRRSLKVEVAKPLDEVCRARGWTTSVVAASSALDIELEAKATDDASASRTTTARSSR